jgi:hypothetical protein
MMSHEKERVSAKRGNKPLIGLESTWPYALRFYVSVAKSSAPVAAGVLGSRKKEE